MNISLALKRLDLSAPEAQVYLFLLQRGQSSAPQIQSGAAVDKVTTYRALGELHSKGYIERLGETRNQQFLAKPIEVLLERYDKRIQELSTARSEVQTFMQDVLSKRNTLYKQHNIQVYEGVEGYRVWNDERLKRKVDVIRTYGRNEFLSEFFEPSELKDYMEDYIKRRSAKGIPIRELQDSDSKLPDYDRSSKLALKESRTVAIPVDLDIYLSIFGDRVGFYSKQLGQYLGVIIEDQMLARTFAIFFDTLWDQGKTT